MCAMVVLSCCHVFGGFPIVVVATLYDLLRWDFMKFMVQGKVILNPLFVESFRPSGSRHSKMFLMIGWIIGA
jgi:hypothetical protein